jgi:hypothetical protein
MVHFFLSRPLDHTFFLVLNDVLVSPNIIKNLISIRRFTTDNNCSIEFDPFWPFCEGSTHQERDRQVQ